MPTQTQTQSGIQICISTMLSQLTGNRLSELIMRFEPPAASRRWENPTFEVEEGDALPLAEITMHVTATFSNHISMATNHVGISLSLCSDKGLAKDFRYELPSWSWQSNPRNFKINSRRPERFDDRQLAYCSSFYKEGMAFALALSSSYLD